MRPALKPGQLRRAFSASFNLARRSPPSSIASQAALVTHSPCEPFAIESFKKWNHDSSRASQRLSQFAHCGRSVFGNEFGHCDFMRSKFSRNNSTSGAISVTSPFSIKKRTTCRACGSDSIALREGGSNGCSGERFADSFLYRLNVDRQRWTMGSARDNGSFADEIALA